MPHDLVKFRDTTGAYTHHRLSQAEIQQRVEAAHASARARHKAEVAPSVRQGSSGAPSRAAMGLFRQGQSRPGSGRAGGGLWDTRTTETPVGAVNARARLHFPSAYRSATPDPPLRGGRPLVAQVFGQERPGKGGKRKIGGARFRNRIGGESVHQDLVIENPEAFAEALRHPAMRQALIRSVGVVREHQKGAIEHALNRRLVPPGTSPGLLNRAYKHAALLALHRAGVIDYDFGPMDNEAKRQFKPLIPFMRYAHRRVFDRLHTQNPETYEPFKREFGHKFSSRKHGKLVGTERYRMRPNDLFVKAETWAEDKHPRGEGGKFQGKGRGGVVGFAQRHPFLSGAVALAPLAIGGAVTRGRLGGEGLTRSAESIHFLTPIAGAGLDTLVNPEQRKQLTGGDKASISILAGSMVPLGLFTGVRGGRILGSAAGLAAKTGLRRLSGRYAAYETAKRSKATLAALQALRNTPGKTVYRGAPAADPNPKNLKYNAVYVATKKKVTEGYGAGLPDLKNPKSLLWTITNPFGSVTTYKMHPDTKLFNTAVRMPQEGKPSHWIDALMVGRDVDLKSLPLVPEAERPLHLKVLQAGGGKPGQSHHASYYSLHVDPTKEQVRLLQEAGYHGTAGVSGNVALFDTSKLTPLYARRRKLRSAPAMFAKSEHCPPMHSGLKIKDAAKLVEHHHGVPPIGLARRRAQQAAKLQAAAPPIQHAAAPEPAMRKLDASFLLGDPDPQINFGHYNSSPAMMLRRAMRPRMRQRRPRLRLNTQRSLRRALSGGVTRQERWMLGATSGPYKMGKLEKGVIGHVMRFGRTVAQHPVVQRIKHEAVELGLPKTPGYRIGRMAGAAIGGEKAARYGGYVGRAVDVSPLAFGALHLTLNRRKRKQALKQTTSQFKELKQEVLGKGIGSALKAPFAWGARTTGHAIGGAGRWVMRHPKRSLALGVAGGAASHDEVRDHPIRTGAAVGGTLGMLASRGRAARLAMPTARRLYRTQLGHAVREHLRVLGGGSISPAHSVSAKHVLSAVKAVRAKTKREVRASLKLGSKKSTILGGAAAGTALGALGQYAARDPRSQWQRMPHPENP